MVKVMVAAAHTPHHDQIFPSSQRLHGLCEKSIWSPRSVARRNEIDFSHKPCNYTDKEKIKKITSFPNTRSPLSIVIIAPKLQTQHG